MKLELYPMIFEPVYQGYLWGGTRIAERFGRTGCPAVCAESWEISDRPEGMSRVRNGPLAGASLRSLMERMAPQLVGAGKPFTQFPLLVKIIDAKQRLSVQVHPNKKTASGRGGEPKTECWHVLEAPPGACVFAGIRDDIDPDAARHAVRTGAVGEILQSVPVTAGDSLFIPAGRLHAIGAGCLLIEIQQNSNTTYRVYDWERTGPDGKQRPLHIEQALQCIDFEDHDSPKAQPRPAILTEAGNQSVGLIECPFFGVREYKIRNVESLRMDGSTCGILFVKTGRLAVSGGGLTETLTPGDSCLLPAALREVTVTPLAAGSSLIQAYLPHSS